MEKNDENEKSKLKKKGETQWTYEHVNK